MLIHYKLGFSLRFFILFTLLAYAGLMGCSGSGGKGLKKISEMVNMHNSDFAEELTTECQPGSEASYCVPTDQDPFGHIPVDWPDDIALHPRARVALGGQINSGGLYMVMLVSPENATALGIQNFYIESLCEWESIQEFEDTTSTDDKDRILIIVAERSDAVIRVITRIAPQDLYDLLNSDEHQYWQENVGPAPLLIRLYYYPSPE